MTEDAVRLEVRRFAQVLITEKVNSGRELESLLDAAVEEYPGLLIPCLIEFVRVQNTVQPSGTDPRDAINYVARACHQMIVEMAHLHLIVTSQNVTAANSSESMIQVVSFPSEAEYLPHRAAQCILGALSIRFVSTREKMYDDLLAQWEGGADLIVSALLDVFDAAVRACADVVPEQAVIHMLLDRAEEIMAGMAQRSGCTVAEQVSKAWMGLESGL